MYDRFNRKINYLRISIIDRCNLRCRYCMPESGIQLLPQDDIISYEEIVEVVKTSVKFGIDKIRITGGEPLVRKDVITLIKMIWEIDGIEDLAMTTNGMLLEQMAQPLANAGLKRINISLDTIDPEKYKYITRGGDISQIFKGIRAAREAGMTPVKINCVVLKTSDELDAQNVARFCKENDLQIRYIHKMDLTTGEFSIVEGGEGGDCRHCNRLRLTANGMLKPCLFSDIEYAIREMGIEQAMRKTVESKPEFGTRSLRNRFYKIGG